MAVVEEAMEPAVAEEIPELRPEGAARAAAAAEVAGAASVQAAKRRTGSELGPSTAPIVSCMLVYSTLSLPALASERVPPKRRQRMLNSVFNGAMFELSS